MHNSSPKFHRESSNRIEQRDHSGIEHEDDDMMPIEQEYEQQNQNEHYDY